MAFRDDPIGFGLQQLMQGFSNQSPLKNYAIIQQALKDKTKREKEEQASAAIDALLEQAGGLTPGQKKIAKGLALSNPSYFNKYIESLKAPKTWWNTIAGENYHPLSPKGTPMGGNQTSPEEIVATINQLKEAGVADEEVADKLQNVLQEEQGGEEFSLGRALKGLAPAAGGMAALRQLGQYVPLGPLKARAAIDLGILGANELINWAGGGRPLPHTGELAHGATTTGQNILEGIEKGISEAIEKKTGIKPKERPRLGRPPLEKVEKYLSVSGLGELIRDIGKAVGFEAEAPKTFGEKAITGLGAGIAALFNPSGSSKKELLSAFKEAGMKAGVAEGLGYLTKKITGSEVAGDAATLGGYLFAQRYPNKIKEYESDKYKEWDKALKGEHKNNPIPTDQVLDGVKAVDADLLKGDYMSPHKNFLRKFIIEPAYKARRAGKYTIEDLYDLRKSLTKPDIYKKVVDNDVTHEYGKIMKSIDKGIDWWGNKYAPQSLKDLRTAQDIHRTVRLTNDVSDSIKRLAQGGLLSVNAKRIALKMLAKPTAAIIDEIMGLASSPGLRQAYGHVLSEGAKNNPEALAAAVERFTQTVKKKNYTLFEKLTKA